MMRILFLFFKKSLFRSFVLMLIFFIVSFLLLVFAFIYTNIRNFYLVYHGFLKKDTYKFVIYPSKGLVSVLFKDIDKDFSGFISDVLKVYPIKNYKIFYRLSLPSSAEINLFGNNIVTDIFLFSIKDKNINFKNEDDLKICLSKKFLLFYNSEISDGNVFPKLTTTFLKMLPIKLIIGKSSFFESNSNFQCFLSGSINCFDEDLPLIGLGVYYSQVYNRIPNRYWKIVKFIGYTDDLKVLNQIKLLTFRKGYKYIDSEDIKIKMEKKMVVYKFIGIILLVIIGFILGLFLVYILWSIFYIEEEILKTILFHFLSVKKIFLYFLGYTLLLTVIGYLLALCGYEFLYNILVVKTNTLFTQYGIDYKLVPVDIGVKIYIFLLVLLWIILIDIFLVYLKDWKI